MSPPKNPDQRGPAFLFLGDYTIPPLAAGIAAGLGFSVAPSLSHQEVSHEDQASPETEGAERDLPAGSAFARYGSIGATGANASSTVSETIFVTSDGAKFVWSDLVQTRPKRT